MEARLDQPTTSSVAHLSSTSASTSPSEIEKTGETITSTESHPESHPSSAAPSEIEKTKEDGASPEQPQIVYPPRRIVMPVMLALYLAAFLFALDRTIIATAIPAITDDFNSLGDVGWYASSYLMTASAFQLLIGRIYTFYNPKWVFLILIGIFELGSLVSGAAPTSTAFIIGRAVAGIGGAGIMSGAIVIIFNTVPLHKRPTYAAGVGAVFGIASVVGPVLGLLDLHEEIPKLTATSYINLPIGAVTVIIIMFVLKLQIPKRESSTLKEKLSKLDPLGTLCFLPGVVCLVLALQWGGTTYSWGNGRVIALLVIFAILMIAFIAIQIWKQEDATVPPRILKNRSIASAVSFAVSVGSSMMVVVYFLPIWLQAIKGVTAEESGIRIIPMLLSLVSGSILAGIVARKTGYYAPAMILCSVVMPIGGGLLTTLKTTSGHPQWIGYQVVYGFGLGVGMQQPSVAAQTVLNRKDISTGASLMFFVQSLGGAVFVAIADNVFNNRLASSLEKISGLNPALVLNIGATEIRKYVNPADLKAVLEAYNGALKDAFIVGLAVACCTVVGAGTIEWKSVRAGLPGSSKPNAETPATPATPATSQDSEKV